MPEHLAHGDRDRALRDRGRALRDRGCDRGRVLRDRGRRVLPVRGRRVLPVRGRRVLPGRASARDRRVLPQGRAVRCGARRASGGHQRPGAAHRRVLCRGLSACGVDRLLAGSTRRSSRGGRQAPADDPCVLLADEHPVGARGHRDAGPGDREGARVRAPRWGAAPCVVRAVLRHAAAPARGRERPASGDCHPGRANRGRRADAGDVDGAPRIHLRVASAVPDYRMTRDYPATARKRSIMFSTSKLVEALRSSSRMACKTI